MATRYVWSKHTIKYVEDSFSRTFEGYREIVDDADAPSTSVKVLYGISPDYTIDQTTGNFRLDNAELIDEGYHVPGYRSSRTIPVGVYLHEFTHTPNFVYYVDRQTRMTVVSRYYSEGRKQVLSSADTSQMQISLDKSQGDFISNISSDESSTYPTNNSMGKFWYVKLGSESIDPSRVSIPTTINIKDSEFFTVTITPRTIKYGGVISYAYEYKIDGVDSWVSAGESTSTTKQIAIPEGANSIQVRVRASDDIGFTSSSYVYSSTANIINNTAPTTPSSITVPTTIKGGEDTSIIWSTATDPDGNLSGYILERKFDSNSWAQIYKGSNRSYTDPIPLDKYKTVTYRVKAYDTENAQSAYATSVTRTIQNSTVLKFRLKAPIESAKRAAYGQEIMTYTIPSGATFKAEACNNGFDENPTWEDITEFVKKQKIFEFANKTKTASKWGYDIRVTVDRNGATGDCYFTRGNGFFEEEGYIPPETDPNTLLLLHCDDLLDSSGQNVPITNSGVTVSTDQSKFGGKSLYFNGSSKLTISLKKLGLDFNSDWTMEWWEKPTENKGISSAVICNKTSSNGFVIGSPNGNNIRIFAGTTAWDFIAITTIGAYNTNWVHRAVCKKGTKVYAFENGTLIATINTSGTYTPTDEFLIGYRNTSSNSGGFVGYIDELRISNIARWTTSFTPSTKPYSK